MHILSLDKITLRFKIRYKNSIFYYKAQSLKTLRKTKFLPVFSDSITVILVCRKTCGSIFATGLSMKSGLRTDMVFLGIYTVF